MRARYALVKTLSSIKAHAAVKTTREHVINIFRLCRLDNIRVRDSMFALDLRLGIDQECYDFYK